jgi:hypothetical protein
MPMSATSAEPSYSRTSPSARYVELIGLYQSLHVNGDAGHGIPPERMFDGVSLFPRAQDIRSLVDRYQARTVLDYGSGKGGQYVPRPLTDQKGKRYASIAEFWGASVTCYDPAYSPLSALPTGRFDGVISTDVLEHCPEDDMPWIVAEMFEFATKFLFVNIACYPAAKRLPNGENAHCTIKPPAWWEALFRKIGKARPNVRWYAAVEQNVLGADGQPKRIETLLQG